MQQQLINLDPDIKRLAEEGFQLEMNGGQYLIVHHIPFVNQLKEVRYGRLVCALTLVSPTKTSPPPDHTIFFSGETPCDNDGIPLNSIINNSTTQIVGQGISVNHYFSSRPISGKYLTYYDKVRTYSEILSIHAKLIDSTVTFKPLKKEFK